MDPNFNQMIFRYGSFWFLLKIHPKWLFIEGFRGPRGVDGFGQFFFEPNGYLPVGNDTKHRQATPFARHMFEEPLNSTEDWRFFPCFFPYSGGNGQIPMLMITWYQLKASSWKSLHHLSPAPDVQSGMNHVEPLDFSVQQVGRIEVFSSSLNQLWNDAKWNFIWLYVALDLFSGQMFFLVSTWMTWFSNVRRQVEKKGRGSTRTS